MNLVSKVLRSATLALSVSLGLAIAHPSQAQNITIASIEGGSSALQGSYVPRPPLDLAEGAIPKAIHDITTAITNYKQVGDTDTAFVAANVTVTDGAGVTETINDAEIRYNAYGGDTNDIRVIVLLRSDSGFGVRYIANRMYISSWDTFSNTDGTALTDPTATAVRDYLTSNAGTSEPIDTGLSDVTADSIVRYNVFGTTITVSGLSGIVARQLAVQTILQLYNITGSQITFSRSEIQDLISGAAYTHGITNVCYREPQSGTRHTELLDVMVQYPSMTCSGPPYDYLCYAAESGGSICNGTGAMLNYLNDSATNPNTFGYSFVTGAAGGGRPNIRVGAYTDSNGNTATPYGTLGTELSLPNNNGQAAYSSSAYYDINGVNKYPLWGYANSYSVPTGNATADSIRDALQALPNIAHLEGFLTVAEMTVGRDSFTSDITGEEVTDGQNISTSPTSGLTFPGNPQP